MNFSARISRGLRGGPKADDLRRWAEAVAGLPEVAARLPVAAEATIRITGDRELRRLNRAFLGHDEVTDVLAFPSEPPYVGDIAISWPRAQRQAAEFGHSAETEVALLTVHGLLHLLGWDHATVEEEEEMTRVTKAALNAAGVSPARGRLRETAG